MNTETIDGLKRCCECKVFQGNFGYDHLPDCSSASVKDVRWHYRNEKAWKEHSQRACATWCRNYNVSLSKQKLLKHENNQLRKKLYPGKA